MIVRTPSCVHSTYTKHLNFADAYGASVFESPKNGNYKTWRPTYTPEARTLVSRDSGGNTYTGDTTSHDTPGSVTSAVINHVKHIRSNNEDASRSVGGVSENYTSTRTHNALKSLESAFYDSVCNTTCRGNCGGLSPVNGSQCYCDAACAQLGDCCLDYEAACLSGPNVTRDNYVDIVRSRKTLQLECVAFQDNPFSEYNITVVTVCGQNTTGRLVYRERILCERSSTEIRNLSTELPVMFHGVIYRNKYCAICNNPGVDLAGMVEANVSIYCGSNSSTAYDNWQRNGVDAFVKYAIDACNLFINMSYFYNLKLDLFRYSCDLRHFASSPCDAGKSNSTFDLEYLASTCRAYRAEVVYLSGRIWYRNPHCALCSGAAWSEVPVCLPGPIPTTIPLPVFPEVPSFNLLFDPIEDPRLMYDGKIMCPVGTWHDHTRDTCVTPTCPPGHVSLDNKTYCVKLNVSVEQIFSRRTAATVSIVAILQTPPNVGTRQLEQISQLLYDMWNRVEKQMFFDGWHNADCLELYEHSLKRFDIRKWNEENDNLTCFVYQILNIHLRQVIPYMDSFRNKFSDVLNETNTFTVKKIVLLNHDINDALHSCSDGTARIRKYLVFPGYEFPGAGFPSTFLVVNTSQVYDVSEVPVVMTWHVDMSGSSSWIESRASIVCEPDILTCKTVTLDDGLYLDHGHSLLLFHGLSVERNVSEKDVLRVTPRTIVVCVSSLKTKRVWRHKDNGTRMNVLIVLASTANIVSMTCLVYTTLTYSLFPSLRKGPGSSVVNLTTALFLAQLSFHVHALFLPYSMACTAVAVFQHYIWLAAFLWMNVLGFDISGNFTKLPLPSSDPEHWTRLRYYLLYAWGSPAVFVAACLGIDHATEKAFFYGQETCCKLGGGNFYLYYFVAPASVIISANIIFFFRTIVALRSAVLIGNQARNTQQQRNTFVIYVRLASLMGVTWLVYFLGSIEALEFLAFTFVLCNLTQGIFICFSFSLTPTVRQLWRRRFSSCESNSEHNYYSPRIQVASNPSVRSSLETTHL